VELRRVIETPHGGPTVDQPMIEGNRWFNLEQGLKNGKNAH